MAELVKSIKVGTSGEWGLTDKRVSTGTAAPSGGSNGDVYLRNSDLQTSGNWKYIIHSNNICECWATLEASATCNTALQGEYFSGPPTITSGSRTFPVTFSAAPLCLVGLSTKSDAGWAVVPQGDDCFATTTTAPLPRFCRPTSLSSASTFYIHYYAIGTVAS